MSDLKKLHGPPVAIFSQYSPLSLMHLFQRSSISGSLPGSLQKSDHWKPTSQYVLKLQYRILLSWLNSLDNIRNLRRRSERTNILKCSIFCLVCTILEGPDIVSSRTDSRPVAKRADLSSHTHAIVPNSNHRTCILIFGKLRPVHRRISPKTWWRLVVRFSRHTFF